MDQSFSWKLTGFRPVKKFPAIHENPRFITTFERARHLSLSWASSIQYIHLNINSWKSILKFSFQLNLGLPSGLFISGFPTKTLYKHLSPHSVISRTTKFSRFYHPHNIGWPVQIINLLITWLPPLLVTSSLLGPNILLNNHSSNNFSLLSYIKVSDKVSHLY